MPSSAATLVLETCLLVIFRVSLFLACRKYLLRNLYHDLQGLSVEPAVHTGTPPELDGSDIELDSLPMPSTSTVKPSSLLPTQRHFHPLLARGLFSLGFSESCTLFLLLMFQALDILDARTRLLNWNISLSLLLAEIVLLIPLSYSLVISDRSSSTSRLHGRQRPSFVRILLNIIPVGLFLLLLSYIPLPSALPSSSFIMTVLSRLTVLGTIILGALSGFGAINTAWVFFPVLYGSRSISHPTEDDIRAAEQGLQRVQDDAAQRRMEVQKLQAAQQPSSESSWFYNVVPSFRGDDQLSSVQQELSGLEALEYQMSRNLQAMKQRRADEKFSQTFVGKVFNWGGRLFAIYCVYRIINSIVNLIIPARRPSTPEERAQAGADMMSTALAYLFSLLPSVHIEMEDVAVISRQISLGLVGVIIMSSIRLVLRGVARALRVTSRSLGASLMLLMLAQLMGIYLLSTLIQLRTSFPPPAARPDTSADGTVNLFSTLPEYQLFGSLFDGSFLIAAGGSAAVRWFSDRIHDAGQTD